MRYVDRVAYELSCLDKFDDVYFYPINNKMQNIGNGISRSVYEINDDFVLKVVSSKNKNLNQNKKEFKNYKKHSHLLPKIYEYDAVNFYWIISERVQCVPWEYEYISLVKNINCNEMVEFGRTKSGNIVLVDAGW